MRKLEQTHLNELGRLGVSYNEHSIYIPKELVGAKDLQLSDITIFGLLVTYSLENSPKRQEDDLGTFVQLSISELSELANVSNRTVARSLPKLEEYNLIKRVPLFGKTYKTYTL